MGCGRCVVSCPVSLDIRHMVKAAVEGCDLVFEDAPVAEPAPVVEAPAPVAEAAPAQNPAPQKPASQKPSKGKSKKK